VGETRRILSNLPRRNPVQRMVSEILSEIVRWQVLREQRPGERRECLEFPKWSKNEKVGGCASGSRGATITSRKEEKKSKEVGAVRGDYPCGVTEPSGDIGHAVVDGWIFLAHNELWALPLALVVFLLLYPSEMSQVFPRLDFAKVRIRQLVSK